MFRLIRPVLAAAFLAAFAVPATAADTVPVTLMKGDRIVFLGDSITAAGVGPKGYVTLIKNELEEKHKDLGVEVIGAGVSGNKVPDIQGRLEKDVLDKKPTIVVIYIGINDVWHGEKDPTKGTSKEKYEAGLRDVIGRCKGAGARVILCTPSVIGEKNDGSNTNDAKLDEYSDISRAVAKDLKAPVCDLRMFFQFYEKDHNTDNKEAGVLTGDKVHLNDAGNKFVADALLKMFGD
jgi:isoamyl acetate esterase